MSEQAQIRPSQNFEVTRMAAPLGAVVKGLDVTAVNQSEWGELNDLFLKYHVLVFPEQNLTPEQHMAFAGYWGELVRHPYSAMADYPQIIELTNHGKKRDVNQHWHSDMTYNQAPPKLTMLYAHQAPGLGGDTAFANQILAYQELSEGLKKVVDELRAEHTAEGLAALYGADQKTAARAEHPVVRTHDESAARALYVCKAFSKRFVGWSREESSALLEYLFKHGRREEFQARHKWRAGDLVMWDNRVLQHYAVHDHGDEPRVIHRLQVEGPVPV